MQINVSEAVFIKGYKRHVTEQDRLKIFKAYFSYSIITPTTAHI